VINCLTNLADRSLLDPYYAGQHRYQFHKLIKEYLKDVESRKSGVETSRIAVRFNSSFLALYTQLLSGFVNRCSNVPHDDILDRFEYDCHNFEWLPVKIYFIQLLPVISIVNLTEVFTGDLMMETFGRAQLYVQTRIILIAFENGMDNISAQIGATETLNLYHDLVLQLRKWMQSYSVLCFILCEATFAPNISSRFQIVNKQLAKSNHNAHDYYNELKIPYRNNYSFHKSICFSCCKLYPDFVGMFVGLFEVLLLLLIGEVNRMRLNFKKMCFLNNMHLSTGEKVAFIVVGMTPEFFLPEIAIPVLVWYVSYFIELFLVSIHVVITVSLVLISIGMVLLVNYYQSASVVNLSYYVMQCALLIVLGKDMITMYYLFICIAITYIIKQFNTTLASSILHFFILAFIVDTYVYELDVIYYVSYFVSLLFEPHWIFSMSILSFPACVLCTLLK